MANACKAPSNSRPNTNMRRGLLLGLLFAGLFVVSTVAECPIQLEPTTVVVMHGNSATANCTISGDHLGIGWEASEGSVDMVTGVQFVTWKVENLTDWHIEPKCYGNFLNGTELEQCEKELQVILFNPPDSVSISSVDHTGPMVEGRQYQLLCEVQNIAPVQNLIVKWYRGETLENETSFNDLIKTPVNESSTLMITPSRADDGAQYSCMAELDLGPESQYPPPMMMSEHLSITVHHPPSFSSPDDEILEVTEGEEVKLNCQAEGSPTPEYSWFLQQSPLKMTDPALVTPPSLQPGTHKYSCIASNQLGEITKEFTVKIEGGPRIVLWSLIAAGVFVAVALIVGYIYLKSRANENSII